MTRFVDGPAAGITLFLQRAPVFLRAVHDRAAGTWDALDQLEDVPQPHEEIVVYALDAEPTWMHVNRDVVQWRAWALEHAKERA